MMIGIAILGTGAISEEHIKAYLRFKTRCEIYGLYNPTRRKAEVLKDKYGLTQAKIYDSISQMLSNPKIDLVSICTPPSFHAAHALKCLASDKNVLVEKPMASSLAECWLMCHAATDSGKVLSVVAQNRYTQDNWKLHELMRKEVAGKLCFGQVESFWYRGLEYYDQTWRGTWEKEGGGCTLNHAVHQIDLLNWMLGRPRTVRAFLNNVAHKNSEVEDVSVAILEYQGGAAVTLTSALVVHKEEQRIVFNCENASISSPFEVQSSYSCDNGFPKENIAFKNELSEFVNSIPDIQYTYHAGQIDNILTALEGHKVPSELPEDGLVPIEIVTAIYQSAFFNENVTLPLPVNSPLFSKKDLVKWAINFKNAP